MFVFIIVVCLFVCIFVCLIVSLQGKLVVTRASYQGNDLNAISRRNSYSTDTVIVN